MKTIVNIISLYKLGKRLDNFMNMLDILLEKKFDIVCVLQNYPKDIIRILQQKRLDIIITDAKNPAHARNVFLKKYYTSDYDYFLFLDDDIIIEKELKTKEKDFLEYLQRQIKTQECVLYCLEEDSFVYRYMENPRIVHKLDFWAGCSILKNLNKFHSLKIYFDEELNALEEIDFACQLWRNKLITLFDMGNCSFCQLVDCSLYGDRLTRKKIFRLNRRKVYEKNKDILRISKGDKMLLGLTIKNGN